MLIIVDLFLSILKKIIEDTQKRCGKQAAPIPARCHRVGGFSSATVPDLFSFPLRHTDGFQWF